MPEEMVVEPEVEVDATSMDDAALLEALQPKDEETVVPEKPAEEVKPETPPVVEKPKEPEVPSETAELRAEIEKLRKQVNDKEKFVQKQGNEIGELRKARQYYEQQALAAQEQFKELFYTDPQAAMNAYWQAEHAQQQVQNVDMTEAANTNRYYIEQLYPDYSTMIQEVAEYGKTVGIPQNQIENYLRDPYGTDVRALIPYVEGAKQARQHRESVKLMEQLQQQVAELDAMPSEDAIVGKIAAASKKGPVLTANSGDSTTKKKTDGLNENNIIDLSDAELEALLKETKL